MTKYFVRRVKSYNEVTYIDEYQVTSIRDQYRRIRINRVSEPERVNNDDYIIIEMFAIVELEIIMSTVQIKVSNP